MFELTNLRATNCQDTRGNWQLESWHSDVWQGGDVKCRTSHAALLAAMLYHWHPTLSHPITGILSPCSTPTFFIL